MRTTHTYAIMEISPAAYAEIEAKMRAAGWHHVFGPDRAIDMHGIAVIAAAADEAASSGDSA
jgi:hypothetical protein